MAVSGIAIDPFQTVFVEENFIARYRYARTVRAPGRGTWAYGETQSGSVQPALQQNIEVLEGTKRADEWIISGFEDIPTTSIFNARYAAFVIGWTEETITWPRSEGENGWQSRVPAHLQSSTWIADRFTQQTPLRFAQNIAGAPTRTCLGLNICPQIWPAFWVNSNLVIDPLIIQNAFEFLGIESP